jgi:hypothetical protein
MTATNSVALSGAFLKRCTGRGWARRALDAGYAPFRFHRDDHTPALVDGSLHGKIVSNDDLRPLPPPAHVTDSIPVLRREAEARQALAELKGVANIIPNQSILTNAIALREAKDSSEIEDIVTTQDKLHRSVAASSAATGSGHYSSVAFELCRLLQRRCGQSC